MKYIPKKGDKIRHKDLPEYGIGVVMSDSNQTGYFDVKYEKRSWITSSCNMIKLIEPNDLLKEIL